MNRQYRIEADFTDASHRTIRLYEQITLTHRSARPLKELFLVLYPNRFSKELPNLDDLNYRLIYPDGPSKGSIDGIEISVDGRKTGLLDAQAPYYPDGTLARLSFDRPWEKGRTLTIELRATVRIPEKFGAFGRYKEILTLSGGWIPYVPAFDAETGFWLDALPPLANWSLRIVKSPRDDLVLQGERFDARQTSVVLENRQARQWSLQLRPRLGTRTVRGRSHAIDIHLPRSESEDIHASFEELGQRWLDFVEKQPALASFPPTRLTWVQAPSREALVKQGERVSFVSDRTFKVLRSLRQYHTAPAIAGLFYQLFYDAVSARESARRYDVVLEVLSWYWAERFMEYSRYVHRDARNLRAVKVFSFVPIVDQMLYSPQFAFVDTIYDMSYPYDPVRDDPLRFNHLRSRGRTLLVHIEDELSPKVAARSIEDYFADPGSYQSIVERLSGRSLEAEFSEWLKPKEPMNYALGKIRSKQTSVGFSHEVVVRRESKKPVVEPVELLVRLQDGERRIERWNGDGNEHVFAFETRAPIQSVRIDPRGRLLETRLSDNQRPAEMKFLLDTVIMNYDFVQNRPEFVLAGQFRRKYGGFNRYHLGGFYLGESYGGNVAYTRLFGRLIDRLRLSHGVSVGYQFQRVVDDNVVVRTPAGSVATQVDGAANLSSVSFTYFTANQISFNNPLGGGYSSISAVVGSDVLGGDRNWVGFDIGGSWIWRIFGHPSHLLAVRGSLGVSLPSDMPTQAYRRLGGLDTMRGLSFTEDRFRGRNMLLTSAEYRHFLRQDVDWNLGFFRVRDVQGALFFDAGRVTSTVQGRADRQVLGPLAKGTGFSDLFDVTAMQTDVGYGIRFHIEYFGVNPSLIRLDAAKSLNQADAPVRYYFGVTQSF